MLPSCDDCATMRPSHPPPRQSPSPPTHALRVSTLVPLTLFLSYCALMLLLLLHSCLLHLYTHSQFGPYLDAPLYPVHIPVPSTPMQTATRATDTIRSSSR